jgi:hypothetical protein
VADSSLLVNIGSRRRICHLSHKFARYRERLHLGGAPLPSVHRPGRHFYQERTGAGLRNISRLVDYSYQRSFLHRNNSPFQLLEPTPKLCDLNKR